MLIILYTAVMITGQKSPPVTDYVTPYPIGMYVECLVQLQPSLVKSHSDMSETLLYIFHSSKCTFRVSTGAVG